MHHELQTLADPGADEKEPLARLLAGGLGTGTTVAFLLPALARRSLNILRAATSPRTEHAAPELGLRIETACSRRWWRPCSWAGASQSTGPA